MRRMRALLGTLLNTCTQSVWMVTPRVLPLTAFPFFNIFHFCRSFVPGDSELFFKKANKQTNKQKPKDICLLITYLVDLAFLRYFLLERSRKEAVSLLHINNIYKIFLAVQILENNYDACLIQDDAPAIEIITTSGMCALGDKEQAGRTQGSRRIRRVHRWRQETRFVTSRSSATINFWPLNRSTPSRIRLVFAVGQVAVSAGNNDMWSSVLLVKKTRFEIK